jgi:hypothetical protein
MKPGTLAYYDSFAGLIPCKVQSTNGDDTVVKLTATRGAYKRGEILTLHTRNVIERHRIRIRCGIYYIGAK